MTIATALLNIALGLVYFQYGSMTLIEMCRNRRTMGFSHFGAAWIAMAFTCGPHHLIHGIHLLQSGNHGGLLDLLAVVIGAPAGVIWFALRIEAFRGGQGDRFVSGSPLWVLALPTALAIYVTALLAVVLAQGPVAGANPLAALPNLMLIGIYMAVGYFLTRTQIANRRPLGGWSVSGLALAVIFPTCALMHAVFAYYTLSGRYGLSAHAMSIDWFAVPAGLYFLWVVHALYRGTFRDWNGGVVLRGAVAEG
jgi:hypothetical protein